jgi:hypothetical protein
MGFKEKRLALQANLILSSEIRVKMLQLLGQQMDALNGSR